MFLTSTFSRVLACFAFIVLVSHSYPVKAAHSTSEGFDSFFSENLEKYLIPANMDKVVIPFDSWFSRGIDSFVVPLSISQAQLAKLLADLNIYKSRMILAPFSIIFKHEDDLSFTFLQKMILNTINLSTFVSSIYSDDVVIDTYDGINDIIFELCQALADFFYKFKNDLSTVNISEIEPLRQAILDKVFLDKLFFIIQACASEKNVQVFINFLFAAVHTEEEENYLWNLIKLSSSPDFCIPLPLEYILQEKSRISVFELISSILEKPSTYPFESLWFRQLSFIIRLNLVTPENAFVLATRMNEHVDPNSSDHVEAIKLLLSAIASDHHILPKSQLKGNTEMMSFGSHMKFDSVDDLKSFLKSIWNLFGKFVISDLNRSSSDYISALVYNSHLQLEKNIPNVIETIVDCKVLHFHINDAELERVFNLSYYQVDLSTDGKIEEAVKFLNETLPGILSNSSLALIRDAYSQVNRVLISFLTELGNIEGSNISEEQFTSLTNSIALNFTIITKDLIHFLPELVEVKEISLLLNLAFEMDELKSGVDISVLILNRIIHRTDLLQFFFDKFAENLKIRPDFVCLTIDLDTLFKIDPKILRDFMSELEEFDIQISPSYISLVELLFQARILDFTFIDSFLEKFKTEKYWRLITCTEFLNFCTTITDNYPFVVEFHQDQDVPDHVESFACLSKLLSIFQSLSDRCPDMYLEMKYFLSNWISSQLSTHKSFKFEPSFSDSLGSGIFIETSDVYIAINSLTSIFLKLATFGASKSDLCCTFAFVKKLKGCFLNENVKEKSAIFALTSSLFNLILVINRTDQSIISEEYISQTLLSSFILKYGNISPAQLLYLSFSDPESRTRLFLPCLNNSMSPLDTGRQHLPTMFEGMISDQISLHIKSFVDQISSPIGLPDSEKVDVICYWMSVDLVDLDLAKHFLSRIKASSKAGLSLEIRQKIFFAFFTNLKISSPSLKAKVLDLVIEDKNNLKNALNYPEALSVVSSLVEYENDVSIQKWLTSCDLSLRTIFNRQKAHIQYRKVYDISEDLEAVIVTYSRVLTDIYKFKILSSQKQRLLTSIFSNLKYLASDNSKFAVIDIDYLQIKLEEFVYTSIVLAVQIINDRSNHFRRITLNNEMTQLMIDLISKFVRRSSQQTTLINYLVRSTKNDPLTKTFLLKALPMHMNWHRFYLSYESFCTIFYYFMDPGVLSKFLEQCIDSAFNFEGYPENGNQDIDRCKIEASYMSSAIFTVFSVLVPNLSLPDQYSIRLLDRMIENSDRISINSPMLLKFFMTVIFPRNITKDTEGYGIITSIFGADTVFDRKPEVVKKVLEFLEKRHDFMNFTFSREQETFYPSFLNNLYKMASKNQIDSSPVLKVLHVLCNWNSSTLEDLRLIASTITNNTSSLTIVSCFSGYCLSAHSNVVEMAYAALNHFPDTLNVNILSDEVIGLNWVDCAKQLLKWSAVIIPKWPEFFFIKFDVKSLQKLFNILIWVEDGEGDSFLLSLFEALDSHTQIFNAKTDVQLLKSEVIKCLGSRVFKERFQLLRNSPRYYRMASILRKWSQSDDNLTVYISNLSQSLLVGLSKEIDSDDIKFLRESFAMRLNILLKGDVSTITEVFNEFIHDIPILRSVHEIKQNFDLIATLLTILPRIITDKKKKTLKNSMSASHVSDSLIPFAINLCQIVTIIQDELCFYSNPVVFNLLLEVIIVSDVSYSSSIVITSAVEILLNLISLPAYQRMALITISANLNRQNCLLPAAGFPSHFVERTPNLLLEFFDECMIKLVKLEISQNYGYSSIDSNYFIRFFALLFKIEANDDKFVALFNFAASHEVHFKMNDSFIIELKNFTVQRKQLMPNIARLCITSKIVSELNTKNPADMGMMSILGLIYSNNPKLFEELVKEKLSTDQQVFMNEVVQMEVLEKKKRVMNDFLEKRPVPTVSEVIKDCELLKTTLNFYTKLDFTLLTQLKKDSTLKSFYELLIGLLEHLSSNSENKINDIALIINIFPLMIQILTLLFKDGNYFFDDFSALRKFMKCFNLYIAQSQSKSQSQVKLKTATTTSGSLPQFDDKKFIIDDTFLGAFFKKLIESTTANFDGPVESDFEMVRCILHFKYFSNHPQSLNEAKFIDILSKLLHDPKWGTFRLLQYIIEDYASSFNINEIIQSSLLRLIVITSSSALGLECNNILNLLSSHRLMAPTQIEILTRYINYQNL